MPYLVLLRHGESVWNSKNVFTGWVDVPLSVKGIEEALNAGGIISKLEFDAVFTSTLVRAMETLLLVLSKNKSSKVPRVIHNEEGKMTEWSKIYNPEIEKELIPVFRDWRLNERYYGELQGKNKAETAAIYGENQVHIWRRSYDVPPPGGEALKDTALRTIPFFVERIVPQLEDDKNILISAHGNSLRSIVMYLEKLNETEVIELELATGKPVLYNYNNGKFIKGNL